MHVTDLTELNSFCVYKKYSLIVCTVCMNVCMYVCMCVLVGWASRRILQGCTATWQTSF